MPLQKKLKKLKKLIKLSNKFENFLKTGTRERERKVSFRQHAALSNAQQPELYTSPLPSHCMRCKQNFHFDSTLIRDKFDFVFCSTLCVKSEIIKFAVY